QAFGPGHTRGFAKLQFHHAPPRMSATPALRRHSETTERGLAHTRQEVPCCARAACRQNALRARPAAVQTQCPQTVFSQQPCRPWRVAVLSLIKILLRNCRALQPTPPSRRVSAISE